MKISVNNKEVETGATTLTQLAEELLLPEQGVAMAVNNRMIPRTEWPSHILESGMSVVIVKAACGG